MSEKIDSSIKDAPEWVQSLFLVSSVINTDTRESFSYTDASRVDLISNMYTHAFSDAVKRTACQVLGAIKRDRLKCIYFHDDKEVLNEKIARLFPRKISQSVSDVKESGGEKGYEREN